PATTGAVTGTAAAAAAQFEDNWRRAVHDGLVPNTAAPPPKIAVVNPAFLAQPDVKPTAGGGLEINIRRDPCVYDGRFVNNGWLQELPNPLNKVTWANVGLISPKTAQRLGINQTRDRREMAGATQGTTFINTKGGNLFSDLVKLTVGGLPIEKTVPMWISPGQPDDVITIFMGYGRKRAGKVGTGLGYNAFDVRRSDSMHGGF